MYFLLIMGEDDDDEEDVVDWFLHCAREGLVVQPCKKKYLSQYPFHS